MTKRKKCVDCNYRYKVGRSPRCNICRKNRQRRQRHNTHLKKTYGITIQEYDQMLENQGGKCAICGGGTSKRHLQLDHDHKTGEPRGLLCGNCNRKLLPAAKNSVGILRAAEAYLTYPPARRVLGQDRDWSRYADE